jgi:hypothetical protein
MVGHEYKLVIPPVLFSLVEPSPGFKHLSMEGFGLLPILGREFDRRHLTA